MTRRHDGEWTSRLRQVEQEHRAALTRALTAQAWAVAITICGDSLYETNDPECPAQFAHTRERIGYIAALPSPAEAAAEIMGVEP